MDSGGADTVALEAAHPEQSKSIPCRSNDGQQLEAQVIPFQYTFLRKSTNIRILEIKPDEPNSEIDVVLHEREIEDECPYHALSYVWGSPNFTHKVYCSEGYIKVTENLHEALRLCRRLDLSILLWVDAICINQADVDERSRQILLMRRIYSGSQWVFVWLGYEMPSDAKAYDFIRHTVETYSERLNGSWDDALEIRKISCDILSSATEEIMCSLTDFFAKNWFSRAWAYQEIICAPNATFSSGPLDINFEYVGNFARLWEALGFKFNLYSVEAQTALSQTSLIVIIRDHFLLEQRSEHTLYKLAKRTRLRLATDSRDKIYSLIAIASDKNALPFPPTYDITTEVLFESFAAHRVRSTRSLDIFECCITQPNETDCASWVPDWRQSHGLIIGTGINPEKEPFTAFGTSCWDPTNMIENSTLAVDGVRLDHLQDLLTPRMIYRTLHKRDWVNDYLPIYKDRQSLINESMGLTQKSKRFKSDEETWQAWWQTLIGEKKDEMVRASADYERLVRAYQMTIDGYINENLDVESHNTLEELKIESRINLMAHERSFCLTADGRIGWVPKFSVRGDIVSIMRGSPVPVIIRPAEKPDQYYMIGQCYIHGIMDGEAVAGRENQIEKMYLV